MRTKYSFYNLLINLFASVLIPVLGFIKVRLFIDLYGSSLNGMQLTLMQFITYLNIFEIAYSLAFRQLLYQPLADGDQNKIKEIYYGAKKIFRFTGMVLLLVGVVFSFVAPGLANSTISNSEVTLSFLVLFVPYALSYFLMGPNFVIIADQQEYKISIWIQSISIFKMLLMVIVILLKLPYLLVFTIEGAQILIANSLARFIALKNYPWLNDDCENHSNKQFLHNIYYTLAHRFADIANSNTDNIIISAFYGYGLVSIYGAYSYFIDALNKIISAIINSPINSFGNLFSENKQRAYKVFLELYSFSSYMGTIIAACIFIFMNQLVYFWIGDESYVLSLMTSFFFAINIYYMTQRSPLIICRDTNGLYKEAVLNSYIMAFVKIVFSIILIKNYKITGILIATSLSYWLIDFLYTPKLVYRKAFSLPASKYYKIILKRLLIAALLTVVGYVIWLNVYDANLLSLSNFVISVLLVGMTIFIMTTIIYVVFFQEFRLLIKRFYLLIKNRGDKNEKA